MAGEAKCWDLWSGKEDFLAMLCLCPPQVSGIRENPDSELSSEDCGWRSVRHCFCSCWKSPKGWGEGWGETFPCPGVRGCLCFLALPHVVSVVRRNYVCSPDKGVLCWAVEDTEVY